MTSTGVGRILFVMFTLYSFTKPYGAERACLSLAKGLCKLGKSVVIIGNTFDNLETNVPGLTVVKVNT